MLAVQLNTGSAAVLVDFESIDQLYGRAPAHAGIFRRAAHIAERDGVDGLGSKVRRPQPHFHVLVADDPGLLDEEFAVKCRFGKSLTPGSCAAQRLRGADAQL